MKKPKFRSGVAVAAQRRAAPKLAHRLEPRGNPRQAAKRELAKETP